MSKVKTALIVLLLCAAAAIRLIFPECRENAAFQAHLFFSNEPDYGRAICTLGSSLYEQGIADSIIAAISSVSEKDEEELYAAFDCRTYNYAEEK